MDELGQHVLAVVAPELLRAIPPEAVAQRRTLCEALPRLLSAGFGHADAAPAAHELTVQFAEALNGDRTLLLPLIGALHELPLPRALARRVVGLALEALGVVDEVDVPAVARTLLRMLGDSRLSTGHSSGEVRPARDRRAPRAHL